MKLLSPKRALRATRPWWLVMGVACLALPAAAQTLQRPARPELPASVWLLTSQQRLIQVDANRPGAPLQERAVTGLPAGDALVAIDYRVARGVMYGVGRSGVLYTLTPATGQAQAVSGTPALQGLPTGPVGFDFNPVADRIRVVTASGMNLRLHPDTGAMVDFDAQAPGTQPDPELSFAAGDVHAGQRPQVAAAAYTYNTQNDKLTTNYVIDRQLALLAIQGSREGAQPVVSPNLGVLKTVGPLGSQPEGEIAFDISDIDNVALASWQTVQRPAATLYRLNLDTGAATLLDTLPTTDRVIGLAIEP